MKKLQKYITEQGVAIYPRISEPDTKWKPAGEFSVKLRLAAADAEKFTAQIQAAADDFYNETVAKLASDNNPATKGKSIAASKAVKRASLPMKAVVDDEGNPTGEVDFNHKMNHRITKKSTNEVIELFPKLFDASTPPKSIPYGTQVWGGSIIRVAGEFNTFYTSTIGVGVQLRMSAVQIIHLVQGKESADGFGFGGQEGGYVAAAEEAPVVESIDYPVEEF